MSLFFETIRIENGLPMHLSWHELRMMRTRKELWGLHDAIDLSSLVHVPEEFRKGIVRCNIGYERQVDSITFSAYIRKPVRSLKPVNGDSLDYHLKYSDRKFIESLLSQRGECDDIIIIKDGRVTDSSFANLVFFDGQTWFTPDRPLLNGTCRERLLSEGTIFPASIRHEDLKNYKGCKLINAMRYPEEEEMIDIEMLRY